MPNIMNIALPDSGFSFKRISYFRIEGIINNSKSKRQRERERERERDAKSRICSIRSHFSGSKI